MWMLQANQLASNAVNAPPETSPELTWFFGGLALFALVMTWIWLWMKMRQSLREREEMREKLEQARRDAENSETQE